MIWHDIMLWLMLLYDIVWYAMVCYVYDTVGGKYYAYSVTLFRRHTKEKIPRPTITAKYAQEFTTVGEVVLYALYTGPSSCTLGRRVQHCTLHCMNKMFRLPYIIRWRCQP